MLTYLRHGFLGFFSCCVLSLPVGATVAEHMGVCMQELEFSEVPGGSCFGPNTVEVSDSDFDLGMERLGYSRLTDKVDAVFLCRNINTQTQTTDFVAMIIHNRSNGKTCFLDGPNGSVEFPSPNSTLAESYWKATTGCVECHVKGPYLINRTAEAMARFGLINNGHDILMKKYQIVGASQRLAEEANELIKERVIENSCANGCHVAVDHSIWDSIVNEVLISDSMPPKRGSVYRWINRDTPGATGDWESLDGVADKFPLLYCAVPTQIYARAVGRDAIYSIPNDLPDVLATFNVKDGLACRNEDQLDGACNDYEVRYLCGDTWTDWYNRDTPGGTGDFEWTAKMKGLCKSPSEIQARTISPPVGVVTAYGPPDRPAYFSPSEGFGCRNADQPDGKECLNYTVKFICP